MLADDHKLVRAGFRSLLEAMPNLDVVAEAADGEEAVSLAQQCQPDIVFMDIAMKRMNGLEAAAQIRDLLPDTRIIILSMHSTADYVQHALRAGATGYMLKDAATFELELALNAVLSGGVYLSPMVSSQVVESYLQKHQSADDVLTPRQTEILRLIAAGNNTKEIAFQLSLSAKTVETHRAQIMERLCIRDIAGLVRYAIRTGLIKADD